MPPRFVILEAARCKWPVDVDILQLSDSPLRFTGGSAVVLVRLLCVLCGGEARGSWRRSGQRNIFKRFTGSPFSAHGWMREEWAEMIVFRKLPSLLMKYEVPDSSSTYIIQDNVLDFRPAV